MSEVAVLEEHKEKRGRRPGSGRKPGVFNMYSRELKEAMFTDAENSVYAKEPQGPTLLIDSFRGLWPRPTCCRCVQLLTSNTSCFCSRACDSCKWSSIFGRVYSKILQIGVRTVRNLILVELHWRFDS
jgi:hypothetical protein